MSAHLPASPPAPPDIPASAIPSRDGDRLLQGLASLFAAGISISMAISNALFALLTLRAAWRIARGDRLPPGASGIVAAFLAFAGWSALSCLWSPLGFHALPQVKVTHLLVFLVFAMAGAARLPGLVGILLSVNALLLLAAPLTGALGVSLVPFDRLASWATRYSGCFTMNIAYGTFLACILLAALGLGPGERRGGAEAASPLRRGLFFGAVALCLIALLLTMSRSAWLGFWVGANLLLWSGNRLLPVALHAAAAASLAAILFVAPLRAHPLVAPFAQRVEMSLAGGSSGRHVLYACAKEIVRERPLLGHGVGAVPGLLDRMREVMKRADPGGAQHEIDFGHLHSNLLQVAAETGLVGVALYLALLFQTLRPFARRLRADRADRPARVALAVILCVFTVGLFEYNLTYSNVSRIYWMILGLCFAGAAAGNAAPMAGTEASA